MKNFIATALVGLYLAAFLVAMIWLGEHRLLAA